MLLKYFLNPYKRAPTLFFYTRIFLKKPQAISNLDCLYKTFFRDGIKDNFQ